ncbi:MAG: SDR family oxidoreductase [Deltaproteobacteria bacterium]|nr:SDR family oxidoreductase [Deltaproteobacteria bacterium]
MSKPNLSGQVAIVTGATQGLGKAFAAGLRQAGATVATCDVQAGCDVVADVSKADQLKAFIDGVIAKHGRLDIVVANAAVCRFTDPLRGWQTAVDDFDFHVNTNLRGLFLTGRAAIPALVESGRGHLVLIGTDHTCRPSDWPYNGGALDAYDASKWGVIGLAVAWACALKPKGVRVNAISMGATDTEMLRGFTRVATGKEPTPADIASWMRPEQLADLLLDLIAEGPSGRTGQNIPVIMGRPVMLPGKPVPVTTNVV